MKGQIIPFVFVVLLVAGTLIGYVFYNMFYGTKYQIQVFHTRTIDVIRNLIESFKDYLKLSLTYSSHQSLREHACLGGLIGAGPWICNGPNPANVVDSKACLEKYTKYYLDVYTSLFNTSLPVELSKMNFSSCVYSVDESGVFSGKYDEGNFSVNCSGSKIAISSKDVNEFESISMNDFITKDRYWYMFRIYYEWAMADVYSPCICEKIGCSCGSSSGEEACSSTCLNQVEECAKRALDDLQRRFDETDDYVECETIRDCCAQGIGPICGYPCGCQPWSNNICFTGCEHKCNEPPPPSKICPASGLQSSAYVVSQFSSVNSENLDTYNFISSLSSPYSSVISLSDDWGPCHYEGRLAASYTFKCLDHKYYVPSDKGPVPLKFVAHAIASWRDPCACCTFCPIICGC